jgi:enamine deaminase RidA (YjgF/YER057c/UK114 family)
MTLERINPRDLAEPQTYTHVVVAKGSTLVFVAGQVAEDEEGNVVGPNDFPTQAHQAFSNLGRALAAAGAIETARAALFGDHKPVDTLLGVDTLAHPGCLLEVDAIAVIDG